MSGIFGIFNRNGKPVEEKTVNTMLDAMSSWEPDKRNTWIDGPIALGHAMLWNTPESKYEHFPLEKDAYVLTMDARIDNRDELLKELELPNRPLEEVGDSEFILAAYKKWGEECPKYLVGDFAFALWDEKNEQIFCARDHIGVKQFYYHLSDDIFIFGNDIKGLLSHYIITKKINDEAVSNYFVYDQLNSRKLTFFEDIVKLPPAYKLTIRNSSIDRKCYWELGDGPKITLPSLEAYVLKLRELLEQAVQDRTRSTYPITSHLSGGLDSSSIAVIAARKLHKKNEKLLAFNWLHNPGEKDNPLNAEWNNSIRIAKEENIEHQYVTMNAEDIYQYMCKRDIAQGETVGFWYEYIVRKHVQSRNSRTILSGWGGDDFVTYSGRAYYADLFCHGNVIYALQQLRRLAIEKNIKKIKSILGLVYTKIIVLLIPRKLYCYMPKTNCDRIKKFLPMVKKDLHVKVSNRLIKHSSESGQAGKTIREDMLRSWSQGILQTRIESWATESISNRLDYVYPMLDKRIIEFMINIPAEYLVKNGEGRYLFRLAVADLLPQDILYMKKGKEKNRVDRFLSLIVSVYGLILDNRDIDLVESKFIDSSACLDILENIDEKLLLENYEQIDASVSILLSEILNS